MHNCISMKITYFISIFYLYYSLNKFNNDRYNKIKIYYYLIIYSKQAKKFKIYYFHIHSFKFFSDFLIYNNS